MERKPKKEQDSGRHTEAWRNRVAADLQAYRAEQQQLFGGIDEMMRARYEAGVSPDDERARVEQAMRDHPALRECMETAKELSAEWQATAPADGSKQKQGGEKPWVDHADRPETEPGRPR